MSSDETSNTGRHWTRRGRRNAAINLAAKSNDRISIFPMNEDETISSPKGSPKSHCSSSNTKSDDQLMQVIKNWKQLHDEQMNEIVALNEIRKKKQSLQNKGAKLRDDILQELRSEIKQESQQRISLAKRVAKLEAIVAAINKSSDATNVDTETERTDKQMTAEEKTTSETLKDEVLCEKNSEQKDK